MPCFLGKTGPGQILARIEENSTLDQMKISNKTWPCILFYIYPTRVNPVKGQKKQEVRRAGNELRAEFGVGERKFADLRRT